MTHVVKLTSKADPVSPVARQRWHARVEVGLAASGLAEMERAGLPAEIAAMNALAVSTFADGDAQWLPGPALIDPAHLPEDP